MRKQISKKEIFEFFGGIPRLANSLSISKHAIYQWKKIPEGRAYQMAHLSNGRFSVQEILNAR